MHVAIVIPCLNEEHIVGSTCASLGFGLGAQAATKETILILVDNGSDDGTLQEIEGVKARSPTGAVVTVREPDKGYVPARHRGAVEARSVAQARSIPEDELLVLQADADTQYSPDYVHEMRIAASGQRNFMVEGISDSGAGFDQSYSGYLNLSARVDAQLGDLFADEAHDVIVSDFVTGYLLSDYFTWGGHRREFNRHGDEIFAETSRLYIRAKILGARRLKVPRAVGKHSRRKILRHPVLHFATAGFPRELRWTAVWTKIFAEYDSLEIFTDQAQAHKLEEAMFQRQAHSLLLFGLIPEYVAFLQKTVDDSSLDTLRFERLFPLLGGVSNEDLMTHTALIFERAFSIIDTYPDNLKWYLSLE